MKKKLDTRFPAARIKKIMQTDEDIGKIAMAVPILVSKALELFLQDLCDRTYAITVQRGAKTVNSLHLKNCVHTCNVFDFLKEVVSKVPDYGSCDATGDAKRRKVAANESNESDDESKRNYVKSHDVPQQETVHASSSGRGRGRGRGRGPGRPRATDREPPRVDMGSSLTDSQQSSKQVSSPVRPAGDNSELKESVTENIKATDGVGPDSKKFDLNAGVDGVSDKLAPVAAAPTSSLAGSSDLKGDEYLGLSEIDRMAIDPVHLTQLGSKLDEEDEDYDEES